MTDPDSRMDITAKVDLGRAELIADPRQPGGWTLLVDGVAQSYVDLDDPRHLEMMYARLMAVVADAVAARSAPIRALHLGGGGLTLPRYLGATRPGSSQVVVEIDRALSEFVRFGLPVRPEAGVTLRLDDARHAIEELPEGEFDLVVSDIYQGGQMPRRVAGTEFAEQAARVLAPQGIYLVNILDMPGLVLTRRHVATLRTAFAEVCVLGTGSMMRGKRDGNVILAACQKERTLPIDGITAAAGRHQVPIRSLHGAEVDQFVSGTAPLTG